MTGVRVPPVVWEATADARQCGLDLAVEMARYGVRRFRDLRGYCDADDVLRRVAWRRGIELGDDRQPAEEITDIADWVWGG